MSLLDTVKIARRFQRSIQVVSDIDSVEALKGFVLPESSRSVLLGMARHARTTQHTAFTWTGPYGSGKSSLLLVLAALFGGKTQARDVANKLVGAEVRNSLEAAFPRSARSWSVIPIVGSRVGIKSVLVDALVESGLVEKSAAKWPETKLVAEISRLSGDQRRSGVLLIIDEMGKLLEAAAHSGGDVHLLQSLAEAANRSHGRLVIVGVLHQAFDEYAQRLSREARDEWAKIQGRFVDLTVGSAGDEQLQLLSKAIENGGHGRVASAREVARVIAADGPSAARLEETLNGCWPLDAVTACLLGPISRRRFGQNQRSLFGFLSSAEPFGFQEFLRGASRSDIYSPDLLWDYLHANLESAILASPDGHRWSIAVEALDRCSRREDSGALHLALLKTIALIDLFRERSGLVATDRILKAALRDGHAIDKALDDLRAWSLVVYRKHLGSYAVFAGSDFDVDEALSKELGQRLGVDYVALAGLAGLRPVLAKRHYHRSGALRWLNIRFVPVSELGAAVSTPVLTDGAIGEFLMAVPTENESHREVEVACSQATALAGPNVVVGYSELSSSVLKLAREFLAMSHILEMAPELAGDAVARREVSARVADFRGRLEAELQGMLNSAVWLRRGQQPETHSLYGLTKLASDVADDVFCESPLVQNELLNRNKPSSNAVAAQKALLRKMVAADGQARLGIEGYPAEGGLFESVLLATGLYQEVEGHWVFSAPKEKDPRRLAPAWNAALQRVENSVFIVGLDELYALWSQPPYGIKHGLLPVFALAFLLANRRSLAFYREGVFQHRLTDLDVDYLAIDPSSIGVRWVNLSGDSADTVQALAAVVARHSPNLPTPKEPMEVARGLVGIYERLAPWTKRTSQLSSTATEVRHLLRQASDPNKLVFDDLPKLVLNRGGEGADFTVGLDQGIGELVSAYHRMLDSLLGLLANELGVAEVNELALERLRLRARNVVEMSGDFRLDAFVNRLALFNHSHSDVEGIASLLVNKPARDWVDSDLDRARIELASMCSGFKRLEAFARVKGRPDGRHAFAVVVGAGMNAAPLVGNFEVADDDLPKVDALTKRLEDVLRAVPQDQKALALAAIAKASAQFLELVNPETWEEEGNRNGR